MTSGAGPAVARSRLTCDVGSTMGMSFSGFAPSGCRNDVATMKYISRKKMQSIRAIRPISGCSSSPRSMRMDDLQGARRHAVQHAVQLALQRNADADHAV